MEWAPVDRSGDKGGAGPVRRPGKTHVILISDSP